MASSAHFNQGKGRQRAHANMLQLSSKARARCSDISMEFQHSLTGLTSLHCASLNSAKQSTLKICHPA
jgi:hypothetical protein